MILCGQVLSWNTREKIQNIADTYNIPVQIKKEIDVFSETVSSVYSSYNLTIDVDKVNIVSWIISNSNLYNEVMGLDEYYYLSGLLSKYKDENLPRGYKLVIYRVENDGTLSKLREYQV